MTEYMGMIYGQYDAKKAGPGGFQPGGASLHSCMVILCVVGFNILKCVCSLHTDPMPTHFWVHPKLI
jgi:homogentisate 1,2-dioxygenase